MRERASLPAGDANPPRILIIEEDPAVRAVLSEALTEAGYQVLTGDHTAPSDGQQRGPSLVVLDLMRDGEPDGYGWLEATRAWPGTAHLPILVCSSYLAPEASAAQRIFALADATLAKPFALHELLRVGARSLTSREPGDSLSCG